MSTQPPLPQQPVVVMPFWRQVALSVVVAVVSAVLVEKLLGRKR